MEVTVSETDRDIQRIYPGPDGQLWVLTSRGAYDAPAGTIGSFDVFDSTGNHLREVALQAEGDFEEDGFFFAGNRLFVVTDWVAARNAMFGRSDEDEEDEEAIPVSVICYEMPDM